MSRELNPFVRHPDLVRRAYERDVSWATSTGLIPDNEFASGGGYGHDSSYFDRHTFVHSAISAKARNIAQVPLRLEEGPEGSATLMDESSSGVRGELFSVFDRPNQYITFSQLLEGTVINLDQDGMAFWVLERRSDTEIPKSITIWRKCYFEPVLDEDGMRLLGWMFTNPQTYERIPLTHSQVVVFRYFNPDCPWMGMSPLKAAIRGINFDALAALYSEAFFRNSGDPGGVIESPKPMRQRQADDLRRQWELRHQGPLNAHKVAVLWGGAQYKQIAISNKDLEFIEQRKWTRDEILAVLKVPKSEISIYEDLTHANALSQNRSFWEKTLIPIIVIINATVRHQFTTGIRAKLGNRRVRIYLDIKAVPALQPNLLELVQHAEKLFKMGWPINAINEVLGLGMPSVPWGDDGYANSSLASFEDILSGEARAGAKPSNPSPPKPSGESGEEGEEGEEGEDTEPEEESVSFIPWPPRKLLATRVRMHYTKKNKRFDSQEFKAHCFRLRSAQIKAVKGVLGNYSQRIIDREVWEAKLINRFPGEEHVLLKSLSEFLYQGLASILESADRRGMDSSSLCKEVGRFFNAICSQKSLDRISKRAEDRRACLNVS